MTVETTNIGLLACNFVLFFYYVYRIWSLNHFLREIKALMAQSEKELAMLHRSTELQ